MKREKLKGISFLEYRGVTPTANMATILKDKQDKLYTQINHERLGLLCSADPSVDGIIYCTVSIYQSIQISREFD